MIRISMVSINQALEISTLQKFSNLTAFKKAIFLPASISQIYILCLLNTPTYLTTIWKKRTRSQTFELLKFILYLNRAIRYTLLASKRNTTCIYRKIFYNLTSFTSNPFFAGSKPKVLKTFKTHSIIQRQNVFYFESILKGKHSQNVSVFRAYISNWNLFYRANINFLALFHFLSATMQTHCMTFFLISEVLSIYSFGYHET